MLIKINSDNVELHVEVECLLRLSLEPNIVSCLRNKFSSLVNFVMCVCVIFVLHNLTLAFLLGFS